MNESLVVFFYLLMRDHPAIGPDMERMISEAEMVKGKEVIYSLDQLANNARSFAARIEACRQPIRARCAHCGWFTDEPSPNCPTMELEVKMHPVLR